MSVLTVTNTYRITRTSKHILYKPYLMVMLMFIPIESQKSEHIKKFKLRILFFKISVTRTADIYKKTRKSSLYDMVNLYFSQHIHMSAHEIAQHVDAAFVKLDVNPKLVKEGWMKNRLP